MNHMSGSRYYLLLPRVNSTRTFSIQRYKVIESVCLRSLKLGQSDRYLKPPADVTCCKYSQRPMAKWPAWVKALTKKLHPPRNKPAEAGQKEFSSNTWKVRFSANATVRIRQSEHSVVTALTDRRGHQVYNISGLTRDRMIPRPG